MTHWLPVGLFLLLASSQVLASPGPEAPEADPAYAPAQPQTAQGSDEWEVIFTPYLFLAPMDGEVSAAGITTDVDIPADALLENLEFGGAARFEVRKDRLGGMFDFFYMGVGGQGDLPLDRQLDVDVDMMQIEGALSYRLGPPERAFDIFGGFRYTRQDYKARIVGGDPRPGRQFAPDWVDPIVGGRLKADLTDRISFLLRGDVGGFGSGSEFTWNVETGLLFRLTRRLGLQLQFKALGVDYDQGAGSTFYEYDVVTPGVWIGLPIYF